MRYSEFENVIYCGGEPGMPFPEKAVGGKWVPAGDSAYAAMAMGNPMSEAEAKEFAGDEWPADDGEPVKDKAVAA